MHLSKTSRFSVIDVANPPSNHSTFTCAVSAKLSPAKRAETDQEQVMASRKIQEELELVAAALARERDALKERKKAGPASGIDIDSKAYQENIASLRARSDYLTMQLELSVSASSASSARGTTVPFSRAHFEDTIVRKMFIIPSFEIHGGVKGLFDLGPPACALKANILDIWKKHFVLAENMLEMECSSLTPRAVLETSGHVEKFTDMMVKDVLTGECKRADHLLEEAIDELVDENPNMGKDEYENHRLVQRQADSYSLIEMQRLFEKYSIKPKPSKPGEVVSEAYSAPFDFNLMFETKIGPEGTHVGYLRPETAQGLFVNFRRLLEYNGKKMPFAAAQIGTGFRNEIAPRNGLLRVREFCMAEIEHFVNPEQKNHPRFKDVAQKLLVLFDQNSQLSTGRPLRMSVGDAVNQKLVENETLGYFMARTQLFMEKIGLDPARLRFRQHLKTEMAHYAADCWDLEIKTFTNGWVECVGHADRSCYDLKMHGKATNTNVTATQRLDAPVVVEAVKIEPNKKILGRKFKKDQKAVTSALMELAENESKLILFEKELEKNGSAELSGHGYVIDTEMVTFRREKKRIEEVKFLPSVIEPSFGIGRILYCLLENSFCQPDENDKQRVIMKFNAAVAPTKCTVFPLQNKAEFTTIVNSISHALTQAGLTNKIDSSGQSIGRRYARADELGTPFGVTVDFGTLESSTVTLRERDTSEQIRLPIESVTDLLRALVNDELSWKDAAIQFPKL